ncbi:MAG: hypothetical protein AUK03_06205 [Anaerolineae bacterium CG2_30_64_16]|nr:MAG: hypothetical protein AUK03_06205 [Anaerolineae bacterium CG2_30_64_16]
MAALQRLLDHYEGRAVIIGGIAASLLGTPRLTADLDALVLLSIDALPELLATAKAEGLIERISNPEAFARRETTSHAMTASLGPNALELTPDDLRALLASRRGRVKSILLDQSVIAGIGNAYIHDILFLARVHPLRIANSLSSEEVEALWRAIRAGLQPSIDKGGAFYEKDLHGRPGGFTMDDVLIGYKEGQSCPACGAPIEKSKTGSTSSFICARCQPARGGGSAVE